MSDKRNVKQITTKLQPEELKRFDALIEKYGVTRYEFLKKIVLFALENEELIGGSFNGDTDNTNTNK